jgi:hypothetical protein
MSPLRSVTVLAVGTFLMGTATAASAQKASTSSATVPDRVPLPCRVTRPPTPPFRPPPPYPARIGPESFWVGTEKLWIGLPASGTWALGHYSPTESAFRQKLLWYRKGYDPHAEPVPKLSITGKRLDAPAPPLGVDGPNGGWTCRTNTFMVVALNIPTVGCWEITGEYGDDKLSFVVWSQMHRFLHRDAAWWWSRAPLTLLRLPPSSNRLSFRAKRGISVFLPLRWMLPGSCDN